MAFNFGSTSTTFGTQNKPTAYGAPLSFGAPAATAPSAGFGGFGTGFGTTQSAFGTAAAQQPAFGSAAAQQPAFGSPFGQPAAGATAPAFGASFGQPAAAAPSFGAPAFGAAAPATGFGSTFGAAATAAPAFGTAFGAPATSAPAFGTAFGSATSTAPAFGTSFGAPGTTAPSLFGSPAVTKPSLFGAPATTAPSLFGAPTSTPGLFGSATTTQAPSLFGNPAATSTTPSLFGNPAATSTTPSLFGTATSAAPSLFNTSFGANTTTTPSLFGGTGTAGFGLGTTTAGNTGFGLFGASTTTTSAPSLFSGFGKTATTGTGFTGFGTTFTGFGTNTSTAPSWGASSALTGIRPPVPTGPTQTNALQQTLASFYAINVFGDERDTTLKKWNMLQACWGTGKGFYNAAQPPIDYNFTNPLHRFKAVGYVIVPGEDNSHGFVKLIFNKKDTELVNQKDVLINGILGILGNKPNLSVVIDHIKGVADNQSEVMIYVTEKGVTGSSRKISALDLCAFLNQSVQKQQLTNVGVTYIGAYVTPTKDQLQEYLRNPPAGVEMQMWQAAQADNPNPLKFMPTPLNGYGDLKKRMLCQQYETNLHQGYLNQVGRDIVELKKKYANSVAKINELKQKYAELHHRLLKIIIKQEVTRKVGMALQPEEELLKGRLEMIITQLGLPTQFRGQLHEIRCNMNLSGGALEASENQVYKMDPKVQEDLKQFLKMEQNGITQLVNIIKDDLQSLKLISEGLDKLRNN